MKSYSLRSLFVLTALVSLALALVITNMRLSEANRELDVVRRNYGHMRVKDPFKINVSALAQENGAYRFLVPPGQRYFLHLSETTAKSELPSGKHKITISLNPWMDGEDVILKVDYYHDPDKDKTCLEVRSHIQGFFDYSPDEWSRGAFLDVVYKLDATKQLELSPREPIVLLRAKSDEIDRGILLWIEPESHQNTGNSS